MSAKLDVRTPTSQNGTNTATSLPNSYQDSFWTRYFLPHQEVQVVAKQESKGVFIPWPLLAILVTLAVVLVSGLVTLEVQVSNLSTTLLLRDQDHARQVQDLKTAMGEIKAKNEQLQVYITNDREKLVAIETKLGIRRN